MKKNRQCSPLGKVREDEIRRLARLPRGCALGMISDSAE
jgi:hypothetical protein